VPMLLSHTIITDGWIRGEVDCVFGVEILSY
jgi:hypothetical protein